MSGPVFWDGDLLFVDGQLAMNARCCCLCNGEGLVVTSNVSGLDVSGLRDDLFPPETQGTLGWKTVYVISTRNSCENEDESICACAKWGWVVVRCPGGASVEEFAADFEDWLADKLGQEGVGFTSIPVPSTSSGYTLDDAIVDGDITVSQMENFCVTSGGGPGDPGTVGTVDIHYRHPDGLRVCECP